MTGIRRGRLTGRQIIADLEDSPVDPEVVRMVRHGLAAIAAEIRIGSTSQPMTPAQIREQAAAIVDPGRRPPP